MSYVYTPIIKHVGFDPSPVAGKIPYWADSRSNPKCEGTRLYDEFWDEQIYRCKHGYKTGGIHLPGKYYHFLNFFILDGVATGAAYPYFVDQHYEIYCLEEEIRKDKNCAGAVIPKKRRIGMSFFGVQQFNWGARFIDRYRGGVFSGLDQYVDGFKNKLDRCFNNTVREFRMSVKISNDDEMIVGYDEKTEQGYDEIENAHMYFKTFKDDESKLEGEFFHDVIAEEAGETAKLTSGLQSISHALRNGIYLEGKFWIYGTGGKMSKAGKEFASVWHEYESYNLRRLFIPRFRYHYPFLGLPKAYKEDERIPYLKAQYPNLKDEQLLGCEDIQAAKEGIVEDIAKLNKNPDKRKLREYLQDMPESVEDVFISSNANNFSAELLYEQNYRIDTLPKPKWKEYVLEFKKDEDGSYHSPLTVIPRLATKKDKEWEIVKIYELPDPKYKDFDIVGVDGYTIDKSMTSKSQGGIVVLRRYDAFKEDTNIEEPGRVPICIYNFRPPRKEKFWEMSLKISILYNAIRNTMIGADSDQLIGYYKDMGCKKYLSLRPRSMDAVGGTLTNEYGIKVTPANAPKIISLMQSWIDMFSQYSWFKELNNELAAYDEENIGTDWDLADALGYALVRIEDMKRKPRKKEDEETEKQKYSFGTYDDKGNYHDQEEEDKWDEFRPYKNKFGKN